ncbi:receptor-like protein 30 isoform X2 [Quercus robur]|uniref:receptor-like protein 30 isoform X2 n=1 Tax=Quercus robur TaxID=38942 RepID=UPI0021637569|nr:receptor-like protein 30 isoform X2 [Quercus robur]
MMMMEGSLLRITLTLLLSLVTIHPPPNFCTAHSDSEVRCIESDRHALLNFKHDLLDPSNRLASWASDMDCCDWVGVLCHNVTGHILQLRLKSFPPLYDKFTINDDAHWDAQYEAYERNKVICLMGSLPKDGFLWISPSRS